MARLFLLRRVSEDPGADQRPAELPSPQRVRKKTAKSRCQPALTNGYQRCVSAGQRAFQRPDRGRRPHPHEFELYYDV